jgi:DNA-binding NarL/FixJ family response regulator
LIVDDHAVVRKGLAMVLRLEPDFDVIGEAGNGQQALEIAKNLKPDVILLDLVMPVMDGLQAARALHDSLPEARLLVLSGAVGTQRGQERREPRSTGTRLSPPPLLDDSLIEMLQPGRCAERRRAR